MREKLPFFHLESTLSNGQVFRWEKLKEGTFLLQTAKDMALLTQGDKEVILESTGICDVEYWKNYFAFDLPMEEIQRELAGKDPLLKEAIGAYKGMRLLRQDPFETAISFITSQNNHIPRIKKLLNSIATHYGRMITLGDYRGYLFPQPEDLSLVGAEQYRELGFGYRDAYLVSAVELILQGSVDLKKIYELKEDDAYREIMKIKGVGRKVASCVLLFAYGMWQVFPVDVWVKKAMKDWYGLETKEEIKKLVEYFGEYAGIAQQYLFHYVRENSKGLVRNP